ncbi:MAG: hypothetical protein AAFV80_02520 [Bacteroidota bacterium]
MIRSIQFLIVILLNFPGFCSAQLPGFIDQFTDQDAALFTGVGINYRLVSSDTLARFQLFQNGVYCDYSIKGEELLSTDCSLKDQDLTYAKAQRIVERFLEFNLSGLVDLNGRGLIHLRIGRSNYLYSEASPNSSILKQRYAGFKKLVNINQYWFFVELE